MSRREAFRTIGGGAALGALAAGGVLATTGAAPAGVDPFLAFLEEWDHRATTFEALPEDACQAYYDAHLHPMNMAARAGEFPNATTAEGAAAALRKAMSFGDLDAQDMHLVYVALAYLEMKAA